MKKITLLFGIMVILLSGTKLHAQGVIAEDYASNYTEAQFEALENRGSGFGDWNRVLDGETGDAVVTVTSAAGMGTNAAVIDTDDLSFSLQASLTDNEDEQYVEVGREFLQPLQDGQELTFQIAWSWQNGDGRAFVLQDGSWEDTVLVVVAHEEAWFVNGEWTEDTEWGDGWREEGEALDVTISRIDGDLHYSVVGITDVSYVDFSGVIEDATADRISFYNDGGADWNNGGSGALFFNSLVITDEAATSADAPEVVNRFTLEQNYPNPFNPMTNITFHLEEASHITLTVYDILGREVQVLEEGIRAAGRHTVQFDAAEINSGIYMYRLSTEAGTLSKTMTLVK